MIELLQLQTETVNLRIVLDRKFNQKTALCLSEPKLFHRIRNLCFFITEILTEYRRHQFLRCTKGKSFHKCSPSMMIV